MKALLKNSFLTIFIIFLILGSNDFSFSQINYYSRNDGNWETNATWSLLGFGGAPAGSYPKSADFAHIKGNQVYVKNLATNCKNLTLYGSGNADAKLEIYDNYLLTVYGTLTLKDDNGNKKAHLHLRKKNSSYGGRLTVNGNVYAYHTGGSREVEFIIEDNSIFTIYGNVLLDYDNGNKNIDIELKNNAQLLISGNLTLDYANGNDKIITNLAHNSLLDVNGNIIYKSTTEEKCEIRINNNSVIQLAGDIQRGNSITGSNYGILDFRNQSTIIYDGNSFQKFSESEGAGKDFIKYNNVTMRNTYSVSPQMWLENNEGGGATINGTLTFIDGVLLLGSEDLIISGNGSIAGGSADSYADVTSTNGGVFKKLVNGIFNHLFPVGDNNDYSPLTFNLNNVSGGNYITINVTDLMHPDINSGGDYITRYWRVNSSGFNTINYDVIYIYTDADLVGNESSLFSSRWNGSSWSTYDLADESNNRLTTSAGITAIPLNHDFTAGNGIALPIELIHFTATTKQHGVLIEWSLLDDYNTDFFVIEKGNEPSELQKCYHLTASTFNPNGNSYTFFDSNPMNGMSYYQLKQTLKDGNTKILGIKAVFRATDDLDIINLFPNPVAGVIYMNIFSSVNRWVTLGVLSNTLEEVKEIKIHLNKGENLAEVDLNDIGPGIYFFKIKDSFTATQLALSKIVKFLR